MVCWACCENPNSRPRVVLRDLISLIRVTPQSRHTPHPPPPPPGGLHLAPSYCLPDRVRLCNRRS